MPAIWEVKTMVLLGSVVQYKTQQRSEKSWERIKTSKVRPSQEIGCFNIRDRGVFQTPILTSHSVLGQEDEWSPTHPWMLLEWIILLNDSGKPHTPSYLTTPGNHLRPSVLGPGVGARIPLPFPSAGPRLVPSRGCHSYLSDCHTFTDSLGCVGWGPGSLCLCVRRTAQHEFWCQLLRKGNLFILVIMENMDIIIYNDT